MKVGLLTLFFVSTIATQALATKPSFMTIAGFNLAFVDVVNGKKFDNPKYKEFASSLYLQNARQSLAKLKFGATVTTDGDRICRINGSSRVCWSPVFENDRIGIRLQGRNDTFFAENKKPIDVKKLTEYIFGDKKVSMIDLLLPTATAKGLETASPDELLDMKDADRDLMVAGLEGYIRLPSSTKDIVDFFNGWAKDKVDAKLISCSKDGNASFTINREDVGNLTITKVGDNQYRLGKTGKKFDAKMVRAKDMKCEPEGGSVDTHRPRFLGVLPLFWKPKVCDKIPLNKGEKLVGDPTNLGTLCLYAKSVCAYPLPKEYMTVQKCIAGKCDQVPDNRDWQDIFGEKIKVLDKLNELEGDVRKVFPQADFNNKDNFGLPENSLSGEDGKVLKDYQAEYERVSKKAVGDLEDSLIATQNTIFASELASRCCEHSECRTALFTKAGLNLTAPSQDPGVAE